MRLVQKHVPSVRVPYIHARRFKFKDRVPYYGEITMEFIPGRTLKTMWAEMNEASKDRVCQDIWDIVAKLRDIPRPKDLGPGMYRTVDGSPSLDPFLGSENDITPRDLSDDTLRSRIWTRYVACNGLSYKDGHTVRDLLPCSDISVFAHGDIGPRNIIMNEDGTIAALIDWESSGWYPDYWEYAQMMKFCSPQEHERQKWMEKRKPKPWDITGLQKARRVLF